MKSLVILLAAAALAGCSGAPPRIVGAPPPGISFRVDQGPTADSNQRAQTYCQRYGKDAHFQGVAESAGATLAQYACI